MNFDTMIQYVGDKAVGVKVFLARDCREEVLVIMDEVGSVDCFGRKAQERRLFVCLFCFVLNVLVYSTCRLSIAWL